MDNQQRKVEEAKLGWLCGFVDGEGSIMLLQMKRHFSKANGDIINWVGLRPAIKISGTDVRTLNYLTDLLDKIGLPYHISWRIPSKPNHKKSWMVQVYGLKRCYRWCQVLLDHCVTKKQEIEMLLEYCHTRLNQEPSSGRDKPKYTERQLAIVQALRGRRLGSRLL